MQPYGVRCSPLRPAKRDYGGTGERSEHTALGGAFRLRAQRRDMKRPGQRTTHRLIKMIAPLGFAIERVRL